MGSPSSGSTAVGKLGLSVVAWLAYSAEFIELALAEEELSYLA